MWRGLLVGVVVACSNPKTEAPAPPPPAASPPAPADPVTALDHTVAQLVKDAEDHGARTASAVAASAAAHERPALEQARTALDKLVAETTALDQRVAAAADQAAQLRHSAPSDFGRREAAEQRDLVERVKSDLAERRTQLADAAAAVTTATDTLDRVEATAKLRELERERDEAQKKQH